MYQVDIAHFITISLLHVACPFATCINYLVESVFIIYSVSTHFFTKLLLLFHGIADDFYCIPLADRLLPGSFKRNQCSRGVGIGRVAWPVAIPPFLSNGPNLHVAHSFNWPDQNWTISYKYLYFRQMYDPTGVSARWKLYKGAFCTKYFFIDNFPLLTIAFAWNKL